MNTPRVVFIAPGAWSWSWYPEPVRPLEYLRGNGYWDSVRAARAEMLRCLVYEVVYFIALGLFKVGSFWREWGRRPA